MVPEFIATISLISVIITTLVLSNQTSKLNTKFKSSLSELVDKINYNQQLELKFDNKQLNDMSAMSENIGDVRKTYQRLDDLAQNVTTKSVKADSIRGNSIVTDKNIRFNSTDPESSASLEYNIGRGDAKKNINRLQINTPNLIGSGFDITTTGIGSRFSIDSKSGDVYIPGKMTVASNLTASGDIYNNNIKLSSNWTGYPDGRKDGSEIANDTNSYKQLMIVGNKSAGGERKVGIWDTLNVNGKANVTGNFAATGSVNQLKDSWFPYTDGNTYIRPVGDGKDINIGDIWAKNTNIGRKGGRVNTFGDVNQIRDSWFPYTDSNTYVRPGSDGKDIFIGDIWAKNTNIGRKGGRVNTFGDVNQIRDSYFPYTDSNTYIRPGSDGKDINIGDIWAKNINIGQKGSSTNVNSTLNTPSGVKITNNDPGPLIDKNYGTNDNRYGIGQFSNGQMRTYTAGAFQPRSVNMSIAKADGSFIDAVAVTKDTNLNPTTTVTGQFNAKGVTTTNDLYANNTKLSGNWSGYPDGRKDGSEIANDTGSYKQLMLVGNKSAGGNRQVGVWDTLNVNGQLNVNGDTKIQNGKSILGDGRLHIAPGEILYLLPKNGVQVSKAWSGNGNLNAEGTLSTNDKLCINGTCVTESQLQTIKKQANA